MAEAHDYKAIGTSPVRPDGVDKVTGRANFGADLNLPNMLHGKVLRSPHAHARIRSVDVSRALEMDGVYAAISGADFPSGAEGDIQGEGGGTVSDLAQNIVARDKALYHGHPVAAVAAKTPYIAERALDLIEVDYEVAAPRPRSGRGDGGRRDPHQREPAHQRRHVATGQQRRGHHEVRAR